MPKRERPQIEGAKSNYFVSTKTSIQFVSSGCTILDCVLGGGYPIGRITNIVGDRSTAKTALATEALINFLIQYPDGTAAYRESEAAFDQDYAQAMGLPVNKIDFGDPEKPLTTVEDFARDFDAFLDKQKGNVGVYILDSLDALSDEAEMERDIGEGSFGAQKAKKLSEIFRKMARKIEQSKVLLIIISQVRDNIGAMFGEKHKRSGGRALDFYASQILWLSHLKTLSRTISKIERPYGIQVKAKVKKNKVGLPLRECDFSFIFGYGIDDVAASIAFLEKMGRLTPAETKELIKKIDGMSDADAAKVGEEFRLQTKNVWIETETAFLPKRKKYN